MPLVTLNNSRINEENKKQFKYKLISNKNNKLYRDKRNLLNINKSLNNSQNIKGDIPYNYIYSSSIENRNNNNISNNTINKGNINKINKKYKKMNNMKINIIDSYSHNSDLFNYKPKFVNSNIIDNINSKNIATINEYNIFSNRGNPNNITECYVSKEKNNKKPKQNPPLSKNSKKLNITSIIRENNKKIKNNNQHQHQIQSFVENNNYHKKYDRNVFETIDYILYPEKYKIKNDIEVLDNFDDMNTIIKRIDFENVHLKSSSIFTLNDEGNEKQEEINYLYKRYSENFNSLFEKNFLKTRNTSTTSQNKNNYHSYHSKQNRSTKDSNKKSSSTKKI